MKQTRPALHSPQPARACAGIAAAAAMLLAATASAWGATCTWSGAANSHMNDAGNWSCPGGGPNLPGTGDILVFPDTAANKTVHNDFAAPPTFHDVLFESGYTVSGAAIKWSNDAIVSVPFSSTADFDGGASDHALQTWGRSAQGIDGTAYFLGALVNVDLVYVGNGGEGLAPTVVTHGTGGTYFVVKGGRLSLAKGFPSGGIYIKGWGTLTVSDRIPGVAAPAVLGSGVVNSSDLYFALPDDGEPAPALEYRVYPPGSYDPGHLTLPNTPDNNLVLNNAALRVVLDDPAQPLPIGDVRTLILYAPGQLDGQFAGLPEGAVLTASNAPSVFYRINYGNRNQPRITLTRVAAPPPAAIAPVPTLGHAVLALLSAALAGGGALRRRKRG